MSRENMSADAVLEEALANGYHPDIYHDRDSLSRCSDLMASFCFVFVLFFLSLSTTPYTLLSLGVED